MEIFWLLATGFATNNAYVCIVALAMRNNVSCEVFLILEKSTKLFRKSPLVVLQKSNPVKRSAIEFFASITNSSLLLMLFLLV